MKPINVKFDYEECSFDELLELEYICKSFNLDSDNMHLDQQVNLLEIKKIILFGYEIDLGNVLHNLYEKNKVSWMFRITNAGNIKKIYVGDDLIAIKIDGFFDANSIKEMSSEHLIIFVIDDYPGEKLPFFDTELYYQERNTELFDCKFDEFHMVIKNCYNINGIDLRSDISGKLISLSVSELPDLEEIHIRDANNIRLFEIEKCGVRKIHLQDCDRLRKIVTDELWNLNYLYIHSQLINDLSFLENLTNLKELHLIDMFDLRNIDPLLNLRNLEVLILSTTGITNVNSLVNMVKLSHLELANSCNLFDITAISNLKNLKYLYLEDCERIYDVSSLLDLAKNPDFVLKCWDEMISEITPQKPNIENKEIISASNNIDPILLDEVSHVTNKNLHEKLIGNFPGEEIELEIYPGLSMIFCWCPKGNFVMGSDVREQFRNPDENQANVSISSGYWMGKYPVTQEQWLAIHTTNPSHHKGENLPVDSVSWNNAKEFIEKINNMTDFHKKAMMRLPTEAEWEYAAKAGENHIYAGGDLNDVAWHIHNSERKTHAVGTKKPNSWGLHDMTGNVWEWCEDLYVDNLLGGLDPICVDKYADERVTRGGGYGNGVSLCRIAYRFKARPDTVVKVQGFRLVLAGLV
jgi:formylglycine-generating enzyme required for sulfatase activity